MKKLTALLLVGSLMFTMAGCGSSSEPASTDTQKDTSGDTTAETTATAADTSDAADTSAQADGMDALIEAAKAEGSLTVYGLSLIHI